MYTNFYEKGEEIIASLPKGKKHVCCGPCACFPFTYLCPHFDLTILYNNSNIFPEAEFWKRLEEVRKLISYMKRDYGFEIKLVVPPYQNEE